MDSESQPLIACDPVWEELSAYLDGEQTAEGRAAVAHHLTECPDCREHHDALLAVRHALRNLPRRTPDPKLRTLLLNRIHAEPSELSGILIRLETEGRRTVQKQVVGVRRDSPSLPPPQAESPPDTARTVFTQRQWTQGTLKVTQIQQNRT